MCVDCFMTLTPGEQTQALSLAKFFLFSHTAVVVVE